MSTTTIAYAPEVEVIRILTHYGPQTITEIAAQSDRLSRRTIVRCIAQLERHQLVENTGQVRSVDHRPASIFRATDASWEQLELAKKATWSPSHLILKLLRELGPSTVEEIRSAAESQDGWDRQFPVTRRVIDRAIKSMLGGDETAYVSDVGRPERSRGRPPSRRYRITGAGKAALDQARDEADRLTRPPQDDPE